MSENDAPERVWVQLIHGKPVLYDRDPRDVHDNGRPVYAYVRTQPDARRDEALQKLDVMFRTWFPARLQEEARSLVNGLITRANLAAPDAAQLNTIDPIGDAVERVWKLTTDRDGFSRLQLRGLLELLINTAITDAVRQARRETWLAAIKTATEAHDKGNDDCVYELNAAALRAEGEKGE